MNTALHVSISSPLRCEVARPSTPLSLLDGADATLILGGIDNASGLAVPVVASRRTLFAPRGVCVAGDGSVWVADTGHHRLLGWSRAPSTDGTAADILVGQPTSEHEGRNAKGEPGPATFNVPTGITPCGNGLAGLAVADAWNHRVLIWHGRPSGDNQPADLVLGQQDFHCVESNRGGAEAGADSLFWPFGVAWDGTRLWVADTGNRRVLIWDGLPQRNGQAADLVLGQLTFCCRDENAGHSPSAASMRWPHSIAFPSGRVCVADAGNNRVMVWNRMPACNGQPCDAILGQRSGTRVDHNQGEYWPSAASLNMPYGASAIGSWLVVADTANSRLLGWHEGDLAGKGASARLLAGQPGWRNKGDNRWKLPARDSLCWPYGVHAARDYAAIADSGNNRVLLWRWSAETMQQ